MAHGVGLVSTRLHTSMLRVSLVIFTVSLSKSTLEVDELNNLDGIEAYSNPANNQLILKNAPSNTVFNLQGQSQLKIISTDNMDETIVDISGLNPGAYYISFGNNKTIKFLKR
jgi:hypothetical protein